MIKNCFVRFCAYLLITCTIACKDNAAPQEIPATKEVPHANVGVSTTGTGEAIFKKRCMACHGPEGNYKNNNAADLSLTRLDSIGIVTTVRHGKGAMPLFSNDAIPDSDLGDLEIYVKSLRK